MSKTIGDKEAQRRALRERTAKPVPASKPHLTQPAPKVPPIIAALSSPPPEAPAKESKAPFDRKAYQREYMVGYRKRVKAKTEEKK